MNAHHDPDETTSAVLTDEAAEAIMRGDQIDGPLAAVAAFGRDVQALAGEPGPPPTAELAARLASPPRRPRPTSSNGARVDARRPSFGRAAKIALGSAVATLGVAGAAAAGVLPDPARTALNDAIDAITPADQPSPDPGSPEPDPGPTTPASAPGTPPPDPDPASNGTGPNSTADDTGRNPASNGVDPDPASNGADPDPNPGASSPEPSSSPSPSPDPSPDPDPGAHPSRSQPRSRSDLGAGDPAPDPTSSGARTP